MYPCFPRFTKIPTSLSRYLVRDYIFVSYRIVSYRFVSIRDAFVIVEMLENLNVNEFCQFSIPDVLFVNVQVSTHTRK